MAAREHTEALGNTSGTAIDIDTGSTRNPRAVLLYIHAENRDAADVWLNFYDAAAADVTPGTGRFGDPIHISASDERTIPVDLLFGRRLSIFASSAADGTGAPTTGVRCDVSWERLS